MRLSPLYFLDHFPGSWAIYITCSFSSPPSLMGGFSGGRPHCLSKAGGLGSRNKDSMGRGCLSAPSVTSPRPLQPSQQKIRSEQDKLSFWQREPGSPRAVFLEKALSLALQPQLGFCNASAHHLVQHPGPGCHRASGAAAGYRLWNADLAQALSRPGDSSGFPLPTG